MKHPYFSYLSSIALNQSVVRLKYVAIKMSSYRVMRFETLKTRPNLHANNYGFLQRQSLLYGTAQR